MSRNRKLFYQQKFLVGKNIAIFFLLKSFHLEEKKKKKEKRNVKKKNEKEIFIAAVFYILDIHLRDEFHINYRKKIFAQF